MAAMMSSDITSYGSKSILELQSENSMLRSELDTARKDINCYVNAIIALNKEISRLKSDLDSAKDDSRAATVAAPVTAPVTARSIPTSNIEIKLNRDMSKCFKDGQLIRHTIPIKTSDSLEYKKLYTQICNLSENTNLCFNKAINITWIGTYNYRHNKIEYNGRLYKSVYSFANAHYISTGLIHLVNKKINGWKESECKLEDGSWYTTYDLPELS